MEALAIIFWGFVAYKFLTWLSKSLDGQNFALKQRAYHAEEQRLAKKYGSGYPIAHVYPNNPNYNQYKQELNTLNRKYDKPQW